MKPCTCIRSGSGIDRNTRRNSPLSGSTSKTRRDEGSTHPRSSGEYRMVNRGRTNASVDSYSTLTNRPMLPSDACGKGSRIGSMERSAGLSLALPPCDANRQVNARVPSSRPPYSQPLGSERGAQNLTGEATDSKTDDGRDVGEEEGDGSGRKIATHRHHDAPQQVLLLRK